MISKCEKKFHTLIENKILEDYLNYSFLFFICNYFILNSYYLYNHDCRILFCLFLSHSTY